MYVADVAGSGAHLLTKLFAVQTKFPNAKLIFAGNYFNSTHDNILTVNMVNNWLVQWHAVALWGPDDMLLSQFLRGQGDDWWLSNRTKLVTELLGGRQLDDAVAGRKLVSHQQIIQWLLQHLQTIYADENLVCARNGVYLNQDFQDTPLDFAVNATQLYWWMPGSHAFAYNQTGRLVVTSTDHPELINGYYQGYKNKPIQNKQAKQSFGIKYPQEPARLFLYRGVRVDHNSDEALPIVYVIDSDQGLIAAI